MKTSNKLVILIVFIFFSSIIGSAMILKQEYYLIDQGNYDPFYGLSRNELPPFSAVELEGNGYRGRIDIRPGEKYEFLHPVNLDVFNWEVRQDTLYLNYSGESWVGSASLIHILTPSFSSVTSNEFECRVHGWETEYMQAHYSGARGFITFTENEFEKFSATLKSKGTIRLENSNTIRIAELNIEDTSNLVIETSQVDSLLINTSPHSNVQLPGALLEKIKR